LVGGTSKKQNWKGLGIAFIVIAIICLFITSAIFLTTNRKTKFFFFLLLLIDFYFLEQIIIKNAPLSISEKDLKNIKLPKP